MDDDQDGGWVNVSSGTGSPGQSRVKGRKATLVDLKFNVLVTKMLHLRTPPDALIWHTTFKNAAHSKLTLIGNNAGVRISKSMHTNDITPMGPLAKWHLYPSHPTDRSGPVKYTTMVMLLY